MTDAVPTFIDVNEPFVSPEIQAVIDEGILAKIDVDGLSEADLDAVPAITREQAITLAKGFHAKIYSPTAHRQLALTLAVFIATYCDVLVDVDGDGVPDQPQPDQPQPGERFEWFKNLFGMRDFDYDGA